MTYKERVKILFSRNGIFPALNSLTKNQKKLLKQEASINAAIAEKILLSNENVKWVSFLENKVDEIEQEENQKATTRAQKKNATKNKLVELGIDLKGLEYLIEDRIT
jgi:regulator of replication initiation timing